MAGNVNNLRPVTSLPPEEFIEHQRKAGKASAKKRHANKSIREAMKLILPLHCPIEVKADMLQQLGLEDSIVNAIVLAQAEKAIGGDTSAAVFVRDTIGEKPTDKMNLEYERKHGSVDLSQLSDAELAELADAEIDNEEEDIVAANDTYVTESDVFEDENGDLVL